jgi:hypothetical protein
LVGRSDLGCFLPLTIADRGTPDIAAVGIIAATVSKDHKAAVSTMLTLG